VLNVAPEFEDCAKAAAERGMSIKDVQALAQKAWLDANSGEVETSQSQRTRCPFLSDHGDRLRKQPAPPGDGA
jgi:hypothetical protein